MKRLCAILGVLVLLLASLVQAKAGVVTADVPRGDGAVGVVGADPLILFSFSDSFGDVATGVLNATDLGGGQYHATSGTLTVTGGRAAGTYSLVPGGPGPFFIPGFLVDNAIFPSADPILTFQGLGFVRGTIYLNIWGDAPGLYSFWTFDLSTGYTLANSGEATATATVGGPDAFACYAVLAAQTLPRQSVTLEDQFRETTVTRTKATHLCNPADKNGENPEAVTHPDHLVTYAITQSVPPVFRGVNGLVVTDQFGTLFVDAVTPNGLLVPTLKSLVASPPPPTDRAVDHFVCYTVKTTAGRPGFVRVTGVNVVDQFGPRTVDLSKPSRLCNPVNKNGEEPGAESHPWHLMCYATQRSQGEPYFTAVSPIFVNNQFGPQQLKATTPSELCVPAAKTPPLP